MRRGEVEVAVRHQHAHVRVHRHRLAQRLADRGEAVGELVPAPVEVQALEDLVGQVLLELELGAHVVVHRRGVRRRRSRRIAGIELELLAGRVAVEAGVAAVQAAHGAALVAQQLLAEAEDLDAQVGALDVLDREPGVARELLRDLRCAPAPGSLAPWKSAAAYSPPANASTSSSSLRAASSSAAPARGACGTTRSPRTSAGRAPAAGRWSASKRSVWKSSATDTSITPFRYIP